MHRRSPLPRNLQLGAFTLAEAREAGIGRKRTRSSDLESPFYGVRVAAGSITEHLDRCEAYAARMPPGHFFSHVTAAGLHGIPLPWPLQQESVVHVSVLKPARAPRAVGVCGHTVDVSPRIDFIEGMAVVCPVETWCQLAPLLSLDDLIAAGDRLLGLPQPLADMHELADAVAARSGRRGARMLREALTWVRPRVESRRETFLRLLIVRAGFPEPETNMEIAVRPGRKRVRGDLVFARYKVLVEYDGQHHRTSDTQFRRDVERLDDVADAGWRVIRVVKGMTDAEVLARLDFALRSRGWAPL